MIDTSLNMIDTSQVNNPHWQGLKFDPKTTEYAMFEGVETEGPFRGNKTLFVIGSIPYRKILSYAYDHSISYLYFDSVGPNFKLDKEMIKDVITSSGIYVKYGVTIASPDFDNQFYQEIKKDFVRWVIPYVWHGEILPNGLASFLAVLRNKLMDVSFIYGKIDTGKEVFVHYIDMNCWLNDYSEGYAEDKLVSLKEK